MKIRILADDLKRIVENTKRFVLPSSAVVKMQYIYFEADKNTKEIKAIAMDGHRMSIEYAPLVDIDESFTDI